MRVLVQALTAAPGGSINVLVSLLQHWPSDDELVCLAWRPEMVTALRDTGHRVVAIEAGSTPAAMWQTFTSHRRMIHRLRPDVVFAQEYMLPGSRAPQVVHHRNLLRFESVEAPSLQDRARDGAVALTLRRSALSVFNSHALRDAAIARWPRLAGSRTAVVHNPVDARTFEQATPRRDPGTVRIIVPQSDMRHKRNDLAVEVLRRLLRHLAIQGDPRPVEMTFVGTGNYAAVRTAAKRLRLTDCVRLPGYLARPNLAALYATSDVALITSDKESFCNPVVESHAAGIPIVTPPLPVFSEIKGPLSMTAANDHAESLMTKLVEALDRVQPGTEGMALGQSYARTFSAAIKALELRELLVEAKEGG